VKHHRSVLRLTALALVAIEVPQWAVGSEASPAPRYHLRVGQEITLRGSTESSYRDEVRGKAREMRYGSKDEWTAWVVRENGDGSKRLILRYRTKTVFPGRESRTPPDSYLAYWDVFDDGRPLANPTVGFFVDPNRVFPRLPEDADAWRGGWKESVAWDGSTLIYKGSSVLKCEVEGFLVVWADSLSGLSCRFDSRTISGDGILINLLAPIGQAPWPA
jgi:hypothetical protein